MENLSPTLLLLWDVRRALEKSQAVSVGIKNYLSRTSNDKFYTQVERWWSYQNSASNSFDKNELYPTRKYLLEILELGLKGQSILETLKSYELELIQSCEDEIQKHLAKLPLLLMIPLMGLIFPSLMLLLVGPLMKSFQF
jgi:hypothetical protein